jgi:hypothetical protein
MAHDFEHGGTNSTDPMAWTFLGLMARFATVCGIRHRFGRTIRLMSPMSLGCHRGAYRDLDDCPLYDHHLPLACNIAVIALH